MTRPDTLAEHVPTSRAEPLSTTTPAPVPRLPLRTIHESSDADLLMTVLGTGGGGAPLSSLAANLLDAHGGVGGLLRIGTCLLAEHRGVGPAKAARLVAALELGRRAVLASSLEALPRLVDFSAVGDL